MKLEEECSKEYIWLNEARSSNRLMGYAPRGMAMTDKVQRRSAGKKKEKEVFKESYNDEDDISFDDYEDLRKSTRTQFQEAEAATEYCETHYYRNPNVFNPNTVQENPFWVDFANHIIEKGSLNNFVSSNFIFATNGDTQAWSVLSLMNLPYESPRQIMKSLGGKGIKITATDNLVLYK